MPQPLVDLASLTLAAILLFASLIAVTATAADADDSVESSTTSDDTAPADARITMDDPNHGVQRSGAVTREPSHLLPASFSAGDPVVDRVSGPAGTGRVETAVAISRQTQDSAEAVVIARADDYADALAGSPLAVHSGAPLLLTTREGLVGAVAAEIDRLGATRAILMGGEEALGAQVEADLAAIGVISDRISGANRFDTAARVAARLPAYDEVVIAEGVHEEAGRGWPDALTGASFAAGQGLPVLLVARGSLPPETEAALHAEPDVVIAGGTAAVSAEVASRIDAAAGAVVRLSGGTRYTTAIAIAEEAETRGLSVATTWIATGRNWPDALAAATATGTVGGIMLLVDGQLVEGSPQPYEFMQTRGDQFQHVFIAGGKTAVSAEVLAAVTKAIATVSPPPPGSGPPPPAPIDPPAPAPPPTNPPAPAPPPTNPPDQQGEIRVEATFDQAPGGRLSAATLREQFESRGAHVPYAEGKDLTALSVVANLSGSGQVLKATLPAGQLGGVMNFPINIIQDGPGYDEVYLSYRLMFGDAFDFTPYGGKLPGLAGGPSKGNLSKDFPAGCKDVTGDNGFSARGMWVSWKAESGKQPILHQYVYHKNKDKRCGDNFLYEGTSGMSTLQANRWYDITHRVVMNDPGQRNGIVEAWLDGEKVLRVADLEFRDDRGWGINVLYMAGFFGGSTDEWKHSRDETMYYDDFVVRALR